MIESDVLTTIVLDDLKKLGLKHKAKKPKVIKLSSQHRLFRQRLEHLKLTDAFLANGTVVQVPKFITEACSFILKNSETEGIFRKAGSSAKQREIKKSLEAALPLGTFHSVIDVANIVCYFFRELPEPLIPLDLHDTLIKCLLMTDPICIRSMQLACLLMSPLNMNTLAYFMQFLKTLTRHVKYNKMSAENLAIVIAPTVMPQREIDSVKLKSHIKVVEHLIKSSDIIGTIPLDIKEKLKNTLYVTQTKRTVGTHCSAIKNKMRKSYIFNGLKTTKTIGSSNSNEDVDCILKSSENTKNVHAGNQLQTMRKESFSFSTYSRNNAHLKPSVVAQNDKSRQKRLTLGPSGHKGLPNEAGSTTTMSTDRRWSLGVPGWSKSSKREKLQNTTSAFDASQGLVTNQLLPKVKLKKECDSIYDRLSSINCNVPRQHLRCVTKKSGMDISKDNTISLHHTRKSIKKKELPPKLSGTENIHPLTNTNNQKTCNVDVLPKPQVKLPTTETSNILKARSAKQEENSPEKWFPAEEFFQNCDEFKLNDECSLQSNNLGNRIKNKFGPLNTHAKCSAGLASSFCSIDVDQGRESIARLRVQNAGMVLAKARLFDESKSCTNLANKEEV